MSIRIAFHAIKNITSDMLPEIILQNRKAWVLSILRENPNLYIETM